MTHDPGAYALVMHRDTGQTYRFPGGAFIPPGYHLIPGVYDAQGALEPAFWNVPILDTDALRAAQAWKAYREDMTVGAYEVLKASLNALQVAYHV